MVVWAKKMFFLYFRNQDILFIYALEKTRSM